MTLETFVIGIAGRPSPARLNTGDDRTPAMKGYSGRERSRERQIHSGRTVRSLLQHVVLVPQRMTARKFKARARKLRKITN